MAHKRNRVGSVRVDANQIMLDTPSGFDMRLFANEEVPIDRASLAEAAAMSGIAASLRELDGRGFFGDGGGEAVRAVFTPDFHKASGIPVGSVLETRGLVFPRAAGNDIGCGMRLLVTDMTPTEFECLGGGIEGMLRRAFFGGERDLPLSEEAREAMLRHGVAGLIEAPRQGLWADLDETALEEEIARSHRGGGWATDDVWQFGDYVRGSGGVSRDAQIASLGQGNHFCEVQRVSARLDARASWAWGIEEDRVAIMVHTGSVNLGGMVGDHFVRLARSLAPVGIAIPDHGFHPLPLAGPLGHHGRAYLSAMGLAANFAAVNRLALGRIALDCLSRASGRRVTARLVYDAPHNLAWAEGDGRVLHRKGACPAERDPGDPLFPEGIPVIVPGSMGAESWVLRGRGGEGNLASAPHGAGRIASRGEGRKGSAEEVARLRVVTPVDPVRIRRDIAAGLERDLLEEAPSAYKPVRPVIDTCTGAGIAEPVAILRPLLTVKG